MSSETPIPPKGSQVRLRYASLIVYLLNIAGAGFSFFFLTIVARKLTVEDYGIWVMIGRYVGYVIIPSIIYSFWLQRNISRGQNTARTGLYSSIMFGLISLPFYILLMLFVSRGFNQPAIPLVLSGVILFFDYVNSALNAISSGYAPEINGYALIIFRVIQTIFVFIFLSVIFLGLTGVVFAVILGEAAMTLSYIFMNKELIRQSKFDFKVLRSWFKTSWLTVSGSLVSLIMPLDAVIVTIMYGNDVPVAFFGICIGVVSVPLIAGVATSALYPKIVCKKNCEDLPEAIWLILLLSIPFIFAIIFYATPIVALFGLKYIQAALPLQLLALACFVQLLSSLPGTVYQALESADETSDLKNKALLHSAWMKSTLLNLVISVLYLISLILFASMEFQPQILVSLWAGVTFAAYLAFFFAYIFLMKRDFKQSFPFGYFLKRLATFLIPIPIMALPLVLIGVPISEGALQMLQNLAVPGAASLALYFLILYVIDLKFRVTIRDALRKVRLVT